MPAGKYEGAVRPQERAPNYPIVAAWSGFLLLIGAGAFALGMAIHNEATAKPPTLRRSTTARRAKRYLYEPCEDRKYQRYLITASNRPNHILPLDVQGGSTER